MPTSIATTTLSNLTNPQLKTLAFRTGLPLTGTKAILLSHILGALRQPRLTTGRDAYRILSIDLGIRNLAYCLLDVHKDKLDEHLFARARESKHNTDSWLQTSLHAPQGKNLVSLVNVVEWNRIELYNQLDTTAYPPDPRSAESVNSDASLNTPFAPPSMAPIAHDLVTRHFLPQAPSYALIERQRHRSGGSSAVLEWTFRVNMLESMIYAVLLTLEREHRNHRPIPVTIPIDPKRVNDYWIPPAAKMIKSPLRTQGDQQPTLHDKRPRGKAGKAERIAIARQWLEHEFLNCQAGASQAKSLLLRGRTRRSNFEAENDTKSCLSSSKLDDLVDSLLQGITFVEWEVNKAALAQQLGPD